MSIVEDALRRVERTQAEQAGSEGERQRPTLPRTAGRRRRSSSGSKWLWAALLTAPVVGAGAFGGYWIAGGGWPAGDGWPAGGPGLWFSDEAAEREASKGPEELLAQRAEAERSDTAPEGLVERPGEERLADPAEGEGVAADEAVRDGFVTGGVGAPGATAGRSAGPSAGPSTGLSVTETEGAIAAGAIAEDAIAPTEALADPRSGRAERADRAERESASERAAEERAAGEREAAARTAAAAGDRFDPETWHQPGLEKLRAGDFTGATEHWAEALKAMVEREPERPVLLISAYHNPRIGRLHLSRHVEAHTLVMVPGWYRNRPAYYMLALPEPERIEAVRDRLRVALELEWIGQHSLRGLIRRIEWHERGLVAPGEDRDGGADGGGAERAAERAERGTGTTAERAAERGTGTTAERAAERGERGTGTTGTTGTAGTTGTGTTGTGVATGSVTAIVDRERFAHLLQDGAPTESRPRADEQRSAQREARRRLGRIESTIEQGRYQHAAEQLVDLREQLSDEHEVWFWSAAAEIGLGNYPRADHFLRQALQRNPRHFESWVQLAVLAQDAGEHEQALDYLDEARRLRPDHPSVLLNRAYSHDSLGRGDSARRDYVAFMEQTRGQAAYAAQRQWVRQRLAELE
ncbi:hypothetical protein CKO15_11780 [Halorhodospira abdelmalekii]|uniref:tetratricopeptide repeat protein n=1 Tax=Halorhodospira abdelmalekii TaxID=421629 RepID=UPI001903E98F|nr:tetratricopeptide repeat protein [Halorhodospira abdelmalekii]MBK1735944.1 hypothetical protein [Halorhodospira abdelmalekii]